MKKIFLRLFGLLFLVVGLIVLANKPIQQYAMKQTTKTYDISEITKQDIEKNKKRVGSFEFDQVKEIDTARILKSQLGESKKELPVVASIAIPSVSIRLPIFKGISNENLLYGAGTMKEGQVLGEGNYALASHHSDQPELLFTPLENVTEGADIYVTDLSDVYTYTVTSKRTVAPTEVEVIDDVPGSTLITLVTCGDLTMTTRVIVQGTLRDKTSMENLSTEAEEAFKLPVKSY